MALSHLLPLSAILCCAIETNPFCGSCPRNHGPGAFSCDNSILPHDKAPDGFLTVREAAEALGTSQAAIRQRIKRGTLPTREGDVTPGLETRHYIPREAVERQLEVATKHDTDDVSLNVNAAIERVLARFEEAIVEAREQREAIERAIRDQDIHLSGRLYRLQTNQEEINRQVSEAIEVLREQADRERVYQERMIQMLDREAERQEERERKGLPERRSLWRRWFGLG